jgi:hypothetical protein
VHASAYIPGSSIMDLRHRAGPRCGVHSSALNMRVGQSTVKQLVLICSFTLRDAPVLSGSLGCACNQQSLEDKVLAGRLSGRGFT